MFSRVDVANLCHVDKVFARFFHYEQNYVM